MKLASLLAQYLYAHKRLDLAGLGSFLLDPAVIIDTEQTKQEKTIAMEGVSFENNSNVKGSPELVDFIANQTGKIRALAAADLDSYLELARQFLNIGKPFLFEGIGSLAKLQSGNFSFNPGQFITEKLREAPAKEIVSSIPTEESMGDYKSILYLKKIKRGWKKPLAMTLILVGLALAIWGGYTIYNRTSKGEKTTKEDGNDKIEAVATKDTVIARNDSLSVSTRSPVAAGNYKFIVEIAGKKRGLERFFLLKGYGLSIQMETNDSISFKLFFTLPAAASDTMRLRDSLRRLYTPAGRIAFVEK